MTGSDYATSVRVKRFVTPGTAGSNRFEATVVDYDSGQPAPADSVSLDVQLSDRADVAPSTVALTRGSDGRWTAFSSALSIDGRWSVTALVQSKADAVEVRMELVTSPRPSPTG